MNDAAITDEDRRREFEALRRIPSLRGGRRMSFDEALKDRGIFICLTNMAELRRRRENDPRPQLELTPG